MSKVKKYRLVRPSFDSKNRTTIGEPSSHNGKSKQKSRKDFSQTFSNFGKSMTAEMKKKASKQNLKICKVENEIKGKLAELVEHQGDKKKFWKSCLKKYESESVIGRIMNHVRKGYEIAFEEGKIKKVKKKVEVGKKKFQNIGMNKLDLQNIKKLNITDYHDEFMKESENFSKSWTDLLKLEKKHS